MLLGQLRTLTVLSSRSATTVTDVNVAFIGASVTLIIRDVTRVLWPGHRESMWRCLMIDFVTLILPLELFITFMHGYCFHFIFSFSLLLLAAMTYLYVTKWRTVFQSASFLHTSMKGRRSSVTYYRAYLNAFTSFSIFAVDFVIYPEIFAKSRVYGIGVMDAGLGCYIFANAIVSPEARGQVTRTRSVIKSAKDATPLLVLGLTRLALVRATGYHVPIREYGTHWNFFFTLAAVKVLSTLIYGQVPRSFCRLLAIGIPIAYELCLKYGLKRYILFGFDNGGGRFGLLDSNREGIVSAVGYLAVYMVGVHVGSVIMKKRETVSAWLHCVAMLAVINVVSWSLYYLSDTYIEGPSRKFANLTYLFWIVGVSVMMIMELILFDIFITRVTQLDTLVKVSDHLSGSRDPYTRESFELISSIDYNGLFYFIAANLMTGATNLTLDTQAFSNMSAFLIVTVYMFLLSCLCMLLTKRKFSLKKWLVSGNR